MKKICFLGSLSTGKTELAAALVEELTRKCFRVEFVKECALDYHKEYRVKDVADQYFILLGQKAREKEAESKSPDFVVCDGSQIHSFCYHFIYEPQLKNLEERKSRERHRMITQMIKEEVFNGLPSYDYFFFLPIEFEAKKAKGRRYYKRRYEISLAIRAFLDTYLWRDPRWQVICGSPKDRLDKILKIVLT